MDGRLVQFLSDIGFEEAKPKLYRKQLSERICLYRDYRQQKAISYAYLDSQKIPCSNMKEVIQLEKLEKELEREKRDLEIFI